MFADNLSAKSSLHYNYSKYCTYFEHNNNYVILKIRIIHINNLCELHAYNIGFSCTRVDNKFKVLYVIE